MALHPRRESLRVIIAAAFLVVASWKEGVKRKFTASERKKVMEAFDGGFSGKELNDWVRVVEEDLEESKWFERNPVTKIEPPQKQKAGDDHRGVKLAKNISGVGIMVSPISMVI
jgi:hypothetical protein